MATTLLQAVTWAKQWFTDFADDKPVWETQPAADMSCILGLALINHENENKHENKTITVSELQDQIGQARPRAFMFCPKCGTEYSANKGNYWACPDDMVLTCCDVPSRRVVRQIIFEDV